MCVFQAKVAPHGRVLPPAKNFSKVTVLRVGQTVLRAQLSTYALSRKKAQSISGGEIQRLNPTLELCGLGGVCSASFDNASLSG